MIRSALLLPMMLMLNGCFFVIIPGSLIGVVADAVTWDEGEYCVPANVKAGDRGYFPQGGIGVVKTISGPSVRCRNSTLPIRANMVPL